MLDAERAAPLLPSQLTARIAGLEEVVRARPAEAVTRLGELLDLALSLEYEGAAAYAICLLGAAAFESSDYARAIQYNEESFAIAQRLALPELESRNLNILGMAQGRLSQYDRAMQSFMDSLQIAMQVGDEKGRAQVLTNMAAIHEHLDEHQRAFELYRDGLEIAQKNGLSLYAAEALSGMIGRLNALGQYRESQRLVPRALQWARTHNFQRIESAVLQYQTLNFLQFGQLEEARRAAERSVELSRQTQDRETLVAGLCVLGEVLLALGQLGAAQQRLSESELIAREIGVPRLEGRIMGLISRLYERQGRYREALELVRRQQATETALRSRLVAQRALMLSQQISVEVMRRESELQLQRNAELARANSVLRQTQVELTRQASQDQLTGLANRSFFWNRAQKVLANLPQGRSLGLIFADIDHLKAINDRYGHAGGDRLISELSQRMRQSMRSGDLVGRLSGDEFMVLLGDIADREELDATAQKLLLTLREPIEFQGQLILPTLSLGCVLAPEDGTDLETLHKHADLALYEAKGQGRNTAVHFTPAMRHEEDSRRQMEQDLRAAIRDGGLQLYYQAQYFVPKHRLSGFEALVRWPHPVLGMVPPSQFIPLAEESRLILELGGWVLREACRQAAVWNLPERGLTVSVNVSARQFDQPDFVQSVRQALQEYGLPGTCLMLELTESMMHHDPVLALESVQELTQLGVQISLDDFGTGYSSLSMIKNFPLEQLKIDRVFLKDLYPESEQFAASREFIEVIVQFAHNLGIRVVVEGVENAEQCALLCEMKCDELQGFWLGKPEPPSLADALLPAIGDVL